MLFIAVMLATICVGATAEPMREARILYINSYAPGYSWSDNIQKGMFENLKSPGRRVEISVEYLGSRRFPGSALQDQQADMMLAKYAAYDHDVVVVSDNAAFAFAIKHRERLFPGLPIVFCGYNAFRNDALKGITNITGVNEEVDIGGLIDTALHIQPDIGTLVFILSTDDDASNTPMAKKAESLIIPKYQDQYEIIVLKNEPIMKIRDALARIPRESAVIILGHTSETGDGRPLTPIEHGRLITAASSVPAYTLWEFYLNTGVLGGRILAGYDQGKIAANMALQILDGKSADSIPVIMKSPASNIFDYNVMQRFQIGMDRLPDDSTVINRPTSLYADHKRLIWASSSIIAVLSVFVVVLLFNIRKRVLAEEALRNHRDNLEELVKKRTEELVGANSSLTDSRERYRSLSDAACEGIVITEKGLVLEANELFCKMFGYALADIVNKDALDFTPPENKEFLREKIRSGYEEPYETVCLRSDDSAFPVEACGKMFSYQGRKVRVTAIRDITEKKKREEELKTLRELLPICSVCKKIRDDTKQEDDKDRWVQIERYLSEHTDANLTHGYCPECYEKAIKEIDEF